MENEIKLLIQTRQNILYSIEDLSVEELNIVPLKFRNSIFWNVAHVVVTQQLLHYFLSGNDMYVANQLIAKYKKGTFFEEPTTKEEIQNIKELLVETPIVLKSDFKRKIFENFKEYPTSYGFTLTCIEDAIRFNNVHEGLHFGYILAMKKSVLIH